MLQCSACWKPNVYLGWQSFNNNYSKSKNFGKWHHHIFNSNSAMKNDSTLMLTAPHNTSKAEKNGVLYTAMKYRLIMWVQLKSRYETLLCIVCIKLSVKQGDWCSLLQLKLIAFVLTHVLSTPSPAKRDCVQTHKQPATCGKKCATCNPGWSTACLKLGLLAATHHRWRHWYIPKQQHTRRF